MSEIQTLLKEIAPKYKHRLKFTLYNTFIGKSFWKNENDRIKS